jgi:hypothetical protein
LRAVAVEASKRDSLSSPIFESHDTHAGKYLTRYRWFVVGGEGLETAVPGRAGREADCPWRRGSGLLMGICWLGGWAEASASSASAGAGRWGHPVSDGTA